MDYQFLLSFIAFLIFCTISSPGTGGRAKKPEIKNMRKKIDDYKPEIKNMRKKIDDYKAEKFYQNTYLYHIPNSRIVEDLK